MFEELTIDSIGTVFIGAFEELVTQIIVWLPRLVIAIILWWLGQMLLGLVISGIRKIDIPSTEIDNKLITKFNKVLLWLGKAILLLIVLDYLGIGRTILGALANGLTITVALAIGIAFGQALKPHADKVVGWVDNQLYKKE